jgi:hypothetical protein
MPTAEDIKEYLLGTCNTDADAADVFGISEDRVLDLVIEAEIECCTCCGWWHEDWEMSDINGADLVCLDCFDEESEDEE